MKNWMKATSILFLSVFLLSACVTYGPPGPSMPAYIGSGKTQTQFDFDDDRCRKLAIARAGNPAEAAQQSQIGSAIIGTLFGAALGAAAGALGGDPGLGAAVGAGAGMIGGTAAGAASGSASATAIQQRWDSEYWGCMYASGHMVPGVSAPRTQPAPIPPPPPPPASAPPSYGPPPAAAAPPSATGAPCKPSGKYVKTPQGFVEVCDEK